MSAISSRIIIAFFEEIKLNASVIFETIYSQLSMVIKSPTSQFNCSITFEKATLTRLGPSIKVYPHGGEAFDAEYEPNDMYAAEIAYLVDCIENNKEIEGNIPEDSALSVKLVNTLIESADKNGEFVPFVVE